jgi:hypothetical protein
MVRRRSRIGAGFAKGLFLSVLLILPVTVTMSVHQHEGGVVQGAGHSKLAVAQIVDLVPLQVTQLAGPQAATECNHDRRCIAVTVAVAAGDRHVFGRGGRLLRWVRMLRRLGDQDALDIVIPLGGKRTWPYVPAAP